MDDKDDELRWPHKTPREVAEYFLYDTGKIVGRKYKTHGDLWSEKPEIRIIGLLELIYAHLQSARRKLEREHSHQYWVTRHRHTDNQLCADISQQIKRVKALVPSLANSHSEDLQPWIGSEFNQIYLNQPYPQYTTFCKKRTAQLTRLRSVKTPQDIINLKGLGPKTAEKILAKLNA